MTEPTPGREKWTPTCPRCGLSPITQNDIPGMYDCRRCDTRDITRNQARPGSPFAALRALEEKPPVERREGEDG